MTISSFDPRKKVLVATDIDGTLVLDGQEVPEVTLRVLSAISQDPRFLLTAVTGRSAGSVRTLIPGITFTAPIITEGGTRIVDPVTLNELLITHLEEFSLDWLAGLIQSGVIGSCSYVLKGSPPHIAYVQKDAKASTLFARDGALFHDAEAFINRMYSDRPSRINFRWWETARVTFPTGVNCTFNERSVDLIPAGVNKGTALQHIVNLLEIPPGNIVVVGNDHNDKPMFALPQCIRIMVGEGVLDATTLDMAHAHAPRIQDVAYYLAAVLAPRSWSK